MPVTIDLPAPGNYTVTDDGIPGNNTSVVRDGNGAIITTFVHPADELIFHAVGPGVTITLDFTDSLGAANLTVGSFLDPTDSPDSILVRNVRTTGQVTLVSNGTVVEGGNDAAADIVASSLIISAATGVGHAANPLDTQVGAMEAETVTGGINLRNFGSLVIGGLTADVNGLEVITSGNLALTNFGTVILSDTTGAASVSGGSTSGNVSLTAVGDSDIIPNVDLTSVRASRGDVALTAGRDIAFGIIGTNFNNDVLANGNLTVNAGRDVIVDGFADFSSDSFGLSTGGDVNVTAGRDINIIGVAGTSASIFASGVVGGFVSLTTGFGGTFNFSSPQPDGLSSNSGQVIVNADRVVIDPVANIRTFGVNEVTIRPRSDSRDINLGSVTDGALALELSDGELDRIFTSRINVGSTTSGRIDVTAAISPLNAANLTLRSATDINIASAVALTGSLIMRAGDSVLQTGASAITLGGMLSAFVDEAGDDGGAGASGGLFGAVTAASVTLNGNAEADTLTGSGGDDTLLGNGGNDTLVGKAGSDMLNGGTGVDTATGGLGNDIYFVDSAADLCLEAVGEGTDSVRSTVTYALAANIENLTLLGAANINGTGNELANIIMGNTGNNVLNGGTGADSLRGDLGNDTYFIDDAGDVIIEPVAGGTDLVNSSVTFTLGANMENLTLIGAGAINGTGNALANVITGNNAANVLNGAGGTDTMAGGAGNDTYLVDNAGDVVTENAGFGIDTIESTITFTLPANVENLTLTGGTTDGTGNTLDNVITGNAAVNVLSGGSGNDDLFGKGGNDDLMGGAGADKFRFDTTLNAAGNVDDILDFSVVDDTIFLDRDIFTGILVNGTLAAGAFRNGAAAADADDRIIYNSATGQIFYDSDGVGGAAQILFATVIAGTALTNADFNAYV